MNCGLVSSSPTCSSLLLRSSRAQPRSRHYSYFSYSCMKPAHTLALSAPNLSSWWQYNMCFCPVVFILFCPSSSMEIFMTHLSLVQCLSQDTLHKFLKILTFISKSLLLPSTVESKPENVLFLPHKVQKEKLIELWSNPASFKSRGSETAQSGPVILKFVLLIHIL